MVFNWSCETTRINKKIASGIWNRRFWIIRITFFTDLEIQNIFSGGVNILPKYIEYLVLFALFDSIYTSPTCPFPPKTGLITISFRGPQMPNKETRLSSQYTVQWTSQIPDAVDAIWNSTWFWNDPWFPIIIQCENNHQ